jgi:hypothetical protein
MRRGFAIRTYYGNGRGGGNSKPFEVEQVTENQIKKKPQVFKPKTCGTQQFRLALQLRSGEKSHARLRLSVPPAKRVTSNLAYSSWTVPKTYIESPFAFRSYVIPAKMIANLNISNKFRHRVSKLLSLRKASNICRKRSLSDTTEIVPISSRLGRAPDTMQYACITLLNESMLKKIESIT